MATTPSLVQCRVCGQPISKKAAACPKCGHPQTKATVNTPIRIGIRAFSCTLAVLCAGLVAMTAFNGGDAAVAAVKMLPPFLFAAFIFAITYVTRAV